MGARLSIYSKLFPVSQRRKSREEDFLTEALADFLSRCEPEQKRNFIQKCLLSRVPTNEFVSASGDIKFETQVVIEGGKRPDLVIYVDDMPIAVVENKIGASVSEYSETTPVDDTAVVRNQLSTYGAWLAAKRRGKPQGAIILLTHITQPPSDFVYGTSTYQSRPIVVRWSEVYRWLRRFDTERSEPRLISFQSHLAADLASFLEDRDMTAEFSTRDLVACSMFSNSYERISSAFSSIFAHVGNRHRTIFEKTNFSIEANTPDAVIWNWMYFKEQRYIAYVSWGVIFPSQMEDRSWWPESAPLCDCAFIAVGSEKPKALDIRKATSPEGWFMYSGDDTPEHFKVRPASDFFVSSAGFAELFCRWLDVEMPVAVKIYEQARKATGGAKK